MKSGKAGGLGLISARALSAESFDLSRAFAPFEFPYSNSRSIFFQENQDSETWSWQIAHRNLPKSNHKLLLSVTKPGCLRISTGLVDSVDTYVRQDGLWNATSCIRFQ